jgi:hypothetical protein
VGKNVQETVETRGIIFPDGQCCWMDCNFCSERDWLPTLNTFRCIFTCVIIVVLTAATIFCIDRFGKSSRVFGRIGYFHSRDIDKKQVENPKEAYGIWQQAGYRGRTIVYISDRWESFDPGELIPTQMFRAYPLQLYNTAKLVEDNYLTGVTFLYVASLNKICRRIVAILPEHEIVRMKETARSSKDVRVSDKGVFVSRQGYPRWFTTGAGFSGVGEPVLLYIGASYFKNIEPGVLYNQLSSSGLKTDSVILCNEAGKDTVTPLETAKLKRFARLMGEL